MKKLALFAIIPVLILSIIAVQKISAWNQAPNYEIPLGNMLNGAELMNNKYIEDLDDTVQTYTKVIPDNFDFVAEDSELELYVEPETLAIAVRVKANGYVYSSYNFNDPFNGKNEAVVNPMKSGVTLELYKGTTPVSFSYLDTKLNPVTNVKEPIADSNVIMKANGFIAQVDFNDPEIRIKFELHVSLENGSLVIDVPANTISEYNPNIWDESTQYYILRNIIAYEYFGSTKSETDGYVVIPDGSGALISLESNPEIKASFTLDVYGDDLGYRTISLRDRALSVKDTKRMTLPVYGMIHDAGNTGFFAISEIGSNYTELSFKSAGLINDYYATYFTYRYRESYEQYQSRTNEDQFRITFQDDINQYSMKQRYYFLSGEAADYVGMAKKYQSHLIEQDMLGEKNRKQYEQTPTKIDFIGQELTLGVLNTKHTATTTYDQVVDTLHVLKADGYNDLITSFKTYDKGEAGYRFDVYRSLGGRSDFKSMMEYVEENDIAFSYYIDYVRSYKEYTQKHAQTLSKREIFHVELEWMFRGHYVNDTEHYVEFAEDDLDNLKKYGIENVALNGFDRSIYTGYNDGFDASTDNMTDVNNTLSYFQENNIQTGVYQPDAYMYRFVDEYYDAPISSSDFSFISASIPFVQLVVGGHMDMYAPYLNFASDENVTLLRLVEYGVFPSYVLTGESAYELKKTNSSHIYISEYQVLKNRINTYYNTINDGLTSTIGKEMINHQFIDYGLVQVEYDDGTVILINYNNQMKMVGTTEVPAVGYVVIS